MSRLHRVLFVLAGAATLCGPLTVLAEEADANRRQPLPWVPYGNLQQADPAAIERSRQLGESVAKSLMDASKAPTSDLQNAARNVARRADDISDEGIAKERAEILSFLGVDPQANTALYYFLSWSMPLEMIRSYMVEAMWSGGAVVFKGVPPGKDLGTFISNDLSQLVYGKSAAANISIDPRLFDAYQVGTVPTIVFTRVRTNMQCQGVNKVPFTYEGQKLSYDTCPPLDASSYIKVTGAVTSTYALQTFMDSGFPEAQPHLDALARGYVTGKAPGKSQVPFAGQWESILTPAEKRAAEEATKAMTLMNSSKP